VDLLQIHSAASFGYDVVTFVVEHEDELHLALEACHWKTKMLENVVGQGDVVEDEDRGTAVFDAPNLRHGSDS